MRTPIFLTAIALAILPANPVPAQTPPADTPTPQTSPASLAGSWHFVLDTPGGDRESDATLQVDAGKVTGKFGTSNVAGTFQDGKLDLAFPYTSDEAGEGTLKFKGTLDGDALKGDWAFGDYSGTFKAARSNAKDGAVTAPAPASAPVPQNTASLSGNWHFVLDTPGGDREEDASFQVNGAAVTGKYGKANVAGTYKDGKLDLAFPIDTDEAGSGTLKLNGTLTGDSISGNWNFSSYDGTFKARRTPSSASGAAPTGI